MIEAKKTVSWRILLRCLLFAYVVVVACPIRFWNLEPSVDNTWVYALNQAAAHGLTGVIWTTGPLGYLMFPQDVGNNLAHALVFQSIAWLVLAIVFADLFFRSGYPLRNLAAFSAFFGLAAPLFWFNYTGLENLMVAATLILLVTARLRGGLWRFAGALVLTGLVPLIKTSAVIIAGGAVAGYVVDALFRRRPKAVRDLALALTVPAVVAIASLRMLLPSFEFLGQYLRGALALVSNYSVAMTVPGDAIEFGGAAETIVWIGVLLYLVAKVNRQLAGFAAALLAIPLCVSFKHAFVRQDVHIVNFFCFAALALALLTLMITMDRKRIPPVLLMLMAYGMVWAEYNVQRFATVEPVLQASGFTPARFAYHGLVRRDARALMKEGTDASFPPEARLEPEILAIVGKAPVATMGIVFNSAYLDGLNLQIYPTVARDGTIAPYLDELDARWLRDQGPRYLLADWDSIDHRQLWAETPAMWLQVYRWYDTRLLGPRHLLLERRSTPRFGHLVSRGRFETRFTDGLEIPESESPVFWSLDCHLSAAGSLQKLAFRIPAVQMTVDHEAPSRVIPEQLTTPVMGNYLPDNLGEMADLMTPLALHKTAVKTLKFGGPGIRAYASGCRGELWIPAETGSTPSVSARSAP